jgi:hypothetical protein
MTQADFRLRPDSSPDPFNEHAKRIYRDEIRLLGGVFEFESSSRALLRLVDAAYSGLPPHRLPGGALRFRVRLQLTADVADDSTIAPPPTLFQGGAGLLTAVMDPANFAVACPATRSGLVAISRSMLRFPDQVRYELLEFVVFTLAHRGQGLVSLHAACVGSRRRGLLLMGESGAGKSVLALHCALQGLEFLTEDATFVAPAAMQATGVSNFLHVKADSLRFLDDATIVSRIRRSPVIRRRSGVEKFEIDMRRLRRPPAQSPLKLAGIVFVSRTSAGKGPLLRPVNRREFRARLESSQPYAANQPNWKTFVSQASALPALELRRGAHPTDGVDALRALLRRQ